MDSPKHFFLTTKIDRRFFFLGVILLITLISYSPVLHHNAFVWDDEGYITNNPVVQSFQMKEIFTSNVMGNYHPLTVLILAVEYFFFGMDATGYHMVNLLLHLLNVILVFYAVSLLSEKPYVALVAALLFGIHPIHVESVAWASGLKDLLFAAFFLSSWIFYLKYVTKSTKYFHFISIFLFLLSLLSKAMAVMLPVVLLLTDFYRGRKMNKTAWLEKIPFFFLALLFGCLAIFTQKSSGNVSGLDFTVPQQLTFACYGFVSYLFKLILPVKLSAFYPYPVDPRHTFPFLWYGYLVIVIILIISVFYSLRKTRIIFFGFGVFTVTIFLVLQWLPVGKAIMADRYSYIPSMAVFFLAADGLYLLWYKKLKWLVIIVTALVTFYFSLLTFNRCGIWKNEITLWNDVLSKYEKVPLAYLNRGIAFAKNEEYDRAIEDIGKAIRLEPNYTKAYHNHAKAYYNRGNLYMNKGDLEKAVKDFDKAVELNPDYAQAYFNRGNIWSDRRDYDKALADYSKAIELDPGEAKPYINRGFVFGVKKEYEKAIKDFDKAEKLTPGNPEIYFNRGILYLNMGNFAESIDSFNKVIEQNRNDAEAYFNRGLARYYSSDRQGAEKDMKQAAGLGYKPAEDFLRILSDQS